MSDRLDFYFRQRVTDAELDLAFELLERADRNLAADLGIYGIIAGALPTPHSPVPDLSVDLTAPARAYDHLGQRIFFGTGQTIDCAVDALGIPTAVVSAGNERWLGVFLRFRRQLSDPRTDGNSVEVYFRRDESFELVVRQGPEDTAGTAPKVPLQDSELLICDVLRRQGQTQVVASDIDSSRRQAFIFASADAVEIVSGLWAAIAPAASTAQAALDSVDALLAGHFAGSANRHPASHIDATPRGFVSATNVQAALDEIVDDLSSQAASSPGAARVGADAIAGTPNALAAGNVDGQLSSLLGLLNAHQAAATNAHSASAVAALPHNNISGVNVQTQLQEIVTDLGASTTAAPGAGLIGVDAIAGTPGSLPAGTLRSALGSLLGLLNGHAVQPTAAHAASAISVADAAGHLDASHVEASLAEILAAFRADHFRSNEASPGQHRTIRQPALGGSKALLLDSNASGQPATHLRIYADSGSVWFTLNASWNGSAWARDAAGAAGSLRLSPNDVELLHENSAAATFTTWLHSWRMPMNSTVNSAFELGGSVQEVGRLALEYSNSDTASHRLVQGGSVTFRNRFPATPSSITFSPIESSNFADNPSLFHPDRDGFGFYTGQTIAALGFVWWFGHYIALA